MITVHLIISGTVQGVGYRKWMKRKAQQLCVVGWVKNREDGAVESIVQGETTTVRQLINQFHQGPPLAHVTGIVETHMDNAAQWQEFIVIQ